MRSRTISRKAIATYYFFQFAATVGWWIWMFNVPEHRSLFFAQGTDELILSKFALPNLAILGGLSLFACFGVALRRHHSLAFAWATFGATLYACTGAIVINWPFFQVPLADGLMVLTVVGSLYFAVALGRSDA